MNDKSELAQRLENFFTETEDYGLITAPEPVRASMLDTHRLNALFDSWRNPLIEARDTAFTNPWTTSGLGHNEVRICSVLASLWDRNRYGAEAQAFLSRFLKAATEGFDYGIDLNEGYRIQTEHCLNGMTKDRVDITVETSTAIVGVEVKIYAFERDMQLPDYVAAIEKRAALMRRERHLVVFLSPYLSRNKDHSVPQIDWRRLSDIAAQADHTDNSGWLIKQFGEFCRDLGR